MQLTSRRFAAQAAVAAFVLITACGGSSAPTTAVSSPSPTQSPDIVAKSEPVGTTSMTILTDPKGMTLYLWKKDAGSTTVNCVGQCLVIWPPFVLTGTNTTPVAGSGVTGTLGVVAAPEGKGRQMTYNGWPLYYYIKDKAPGDTTGQGVGGTWFVVPPDQAKNT